MSEFVAYTDGGCRGNPGRGGWAFILVDPATGSSLERCGGEAETTNNRMEILAAIHAMQALRRPGQDLLIHSDSQYVINSATTWITGWKAKGWKRPGGQLKNVDLLQELDRQLAVHRVRWRWVRGHVGDRGNERADALANLAMDRLAQGLDPAWEQRTTWQL